MYVCMYVYICKYVCMYVYIYFLFNGSTALVGPGRYFGFLIYLRAVGLLGRVISSSQGLYLNT
jgi:ABC-type enterochelin transport system permease subunit